jgi:hypothetical protein
MNQKEKDDKVATRVAEEISEIRRDELIGVVRETVVQLEVLADRLEGFLREHEESES